MANAPRLTVTVPKAWLLPCDCCDTLIYKAHSGVWYHAETGNTLCDLFGDQNRLASYTERPQERLL